MLNRYIVHFTDETTLLVMAKDMVNAMSEAIAQTGKEVTKIERA